jgi:DNA replication protein DnaC
MLHHATRFLAEVVTRKSPPRWLSFLGPSGTGKTMLARTLYRFIKEHCLMFSPGYGIRLTDQCYSAQWPAATQEMKAGDFSAVDRLIEKETKWDNTRGMTYSYAMIDDIGQVEDNAKAYLIGALGRIADARMGSWTIWTANLGLEQLGECLDKRITSRMIRGGNVVVENNCTDYNLR